MMMLVATLAVFTGSVVFFPGVENITKGVQSDVSLGLLTLFVVVAITAGVIKGMIGF